MTRVARGNHDTNSSNDPWSQNPCTGVDSMLPLQGVKTIHEFIYLSIPFLASLHLQRTLVLTDSRIKVREAGSRLRNRWIQKLNKHRWRVLTALPVAPTCLMSDQKYLYTSKANSDHSNPPGFSIYSSFRNKCQPLRRQTNTNFTFRNIY